MCPSWAWNEASTVHIFVTTLVHCTIIPQLSWQIILYILLLRVSIQSWYKQACIISMHSTSVPLFHLSPFHLGTLPPLQVVNKDNMNVSFHFAKVSPSSIHNYYLHVHSTSSVQTSSFILLHSPFPFQNSPSSGVSVIIISVLSTSPFPLSNFQFQAAVPKVESACNCSSTCTCTVSVHIVA